MSKGLVAETTELLEPFLKENGYSLYHIVYLKEGSNWILRVFIEGENPISLDDCQKVSQFLSKALDDIEVTAPSYFLEVSSPGVERELIKDEHYQRFIGHRVELKTYKPINGTKVILGTLESYILENQETYLIIKDEKGALNRINKKDVSKARLVVEF